MLIKILPPILSPKYYKFVRSHIRLRGLTPNFTHC